MTPRTVWLFLGLLAFTGLLTPLYATEDAFIYVDRMPDVRGEHARRLSGEDDERGVSIVQDLYSEDFEHALIETYVMKVACAEGAPDAEPRPYILAIKYLPKRPENFAVATLHDIYKDVYVLDRTGRIRLYEDVQGEAMLTLAERFRPTCLPI